MTLLEGEYAVDIQAADYLTVTKVTLSTFD